MKGSRTGSTDLSRGLTGLELLILVTICVAAIAGGIAWEGHRGGAKNPSGIIPLSVATAERAMVVSGETYGYWVQDGMAGEIPVALGGESLPMIDAISVPVQLIVGEGPLDMGSLRVAVGYGGGAETLVRDGTGRPGRSSWAVTGKAGVLPLGKADQDDLLEPPETFQIIVLPSQPLDPGGHVTITLSPPLGISLVIERQIPAHVNPVTLLSL